MCAIRTDNSIKNHWNSSVKKKLDMYLASGLLAQFQGLPLVHHPNQSEASSSSKAQQTSEDNSVVKGGNEAEEASECSQGSFVPSMSQPTSNTIIHPMGECRITEESSSLPYSEDYRPGFQETGFAIPEAPCELSNKFLEHDFSLDWGALEGKDWQINPNDLPDMSLLDLGQESPGMFMLASSSGQDTDHETMPFQQESHIPLGSFTSMVNMAIDTDTPNRNASSDCRLVYSEADHGGGCPSDIINHIDSLLHHSSRLQILEDGDFATQSCYTSSDMLGTSFPQSVPFPMQLPSADGQLIFDTDPSQYSNSHAVQESISPSTHNGFIYSMESDCLPCEDNSVGAKETPKLVPINDFVLTSSSDPQHCPLDSGEQKDAKTEEQKDSGALFYEPPRFPSLDVPFFSCDLVQSGNDMHQEYSPLGIRQLMISSSMTPFKLWDSPSRDDSPDAILKSAAKTFTGTPSILKKRHRDLLSPMSEKRDEKKLEGCRKQESYSNLSNNFSRLETMFDECSDKKGQLLSLSPSRRNFEVCCTEKENTTPALELERNEGNESNVISEREMTKEFNNNSGYCSNRTTENIAATDVSTKNAGKDLTKMVSSLILSPLCI